MKGIVAFLAIFVAYGQAASFDQVAYSKTLIFQQWENFKLEYDKSYESDYEGHIRLQIFMENLEKINKHNKLHALGLTSYSMAVNQFSDLTGNEFLRRYTLDFSQRGNLTGVEIWGGDVEIEGFIIHAPPSHDDGDDLAAEVDWREKGYVTAVKDQEECGSCWTFSAVGALEGQWFKSKGKLVELSEQNLLDCSSNYGNHACNGGWMPSAFKYIIKNGGIDTESSYPYQGHESSSCLFKKENIGATASSIVYVPQGENELKSKVGTVGPIAIAVQVMDSFMAYGKGVYDDPNCGSELNHAMLVVGYGTEDGKDYWLVKNSWGTSWGEQGYVKMARNKNDQCGISQAASYPVV